MLLISTNIFTIFLRYFFFQRKCAIEFAKLEMKVEKEGGEGGGKTEIERDRHRDNNCDRGKNRESERTSSGGLLFSSVGRTINFGMTVEGDRHKPDIREREMGEEERGRERGREERMCRVGKSVRNSRQEKWKPKEIRDVWREGGTRTVTMP